MTGSDIEITGLNTGSPAAEAYRVLRTNIQYANVDNPLKTIVVTSTGPGEGKTTTAINLAVVFAQDQYKVLVIDADLRRPKIHKVLNLASNKGLTDILVRHSGFRSYVKKIERYKIDLITSGRIPANPSEMLNSNTFKELLAGIKEEYDIVIIDSPPVLSVTDAVILSKMADGTLIVACSGKVRGDDLKKTVEILEKVDSNIIGIVLNKTTNSKRYYMYYYYSQKP
jgi:capsular exopolysaccharide synthesis family protein